MILSSVIDALVIAGARPARPGEFTRRALENGRTSLLGAEALAAFLAERLPELQAVSWCQNGFGEPGVRKLLSAFERFGLQAADWVA